MFSLNSSERYYLYDQSCDMRKSFSSLSGLVRNEMNRDPLNGDVYIFINKRGNQVKLLHWEFGGFVIYYKRLEQGVFERSPTGDTQQISWASLVMMIEGIKVEKVVQNPRYKLNI